MSPIACLILALGAIGHIVLWVALVNRIHALGIKRIWVDLATLLCVIALATLPFVILAILAGFVPPPVEMLRNSFLRGVWTYLTLCSAVLVVASFQRWTWSRSREHYGALLSNHRSPIHVADNSAPLLAPGLAAVLGGLPGNQVLTLCIEQKKIAIPRLSNASPPIRIAHLTDLHMSGRITRKYFERVVEETNALEPDLIAITGDIVERERCLEWLPDTLGRLHAGSGVYYVLGNHDHHVDISNLKAALANAGLIHVGGRCIGIKVQGTSCQIGGNELPWFKPATDFDAVADRDVAESPLRILLAHSPDEFQWARQNNVDLMLAGHLHGGQLRFPLLGAVASPSRYGVRYAHGVFKAEKTVMHVSRGTSSLTPLRYNCPPEISLLTLLPVAPS